MLSVLILASWSVGCGAVVQVTGAGIPLPTFNLPVTNAPPLPPLPLPQLPNIDTIVRMGFPNIPYSATNTYSSNGVTNYANPSQFFNNNFNTDIFGFNQRICPKQAEYPDVATFSGNPTGYPVNEITAALLNNPVLLGCLTPEVVLPTAPTIPTDPVLANANATCEFLETKLWRFARYGGRCWILQNFQEVVTFVTCLSKQCANCDEFWPFSNYENRCLRGYKYVSVWAYCEALPINQRIVRERIITPHTCSCQTVKCSRYWKK
ncbi:uncharacterized protein [Haliotis cracherodii]|uniref:uncharacterized protein n=1 Tax=Haliotis cracherodii TaxID=6455 RepID=UPI0039E9DEEB